MVLALVVFVGAAVGAWRAFPSTERGLDWAPLAVAAVVGVPVAIALNALEFKASGLIVSRRVPLPQAVRITVLGSAANVLPIPGSSIVRVRALAQGGVTYGRAISAAAAVGAVFVGTTILVAGLVQLLARPVLGVIWVAVGLGVVRLAHVLVRRGVGAAGHRVTAITIAIEAAFVAVGAVRLWLVLEGLGVDVGASEAVALTVAGALATAVGFFPGGLGIRELIAAGISPLVGLPAAAGLGASVVDRFLWFVVLGVITLGYVVSGRGFATLPVQSSTEAFGPRSNGMDP